LRGIQISHSRDCHDGFFAILHFQSDQGNSRFWICLGGFPIKRLFPDEEYPAPSKESNLYGIGGQRIEPTELEITITG
jgi:hypothetical protein